DLVNRAGRVVTCLRRAKRPAIRDGKCGFQNASSPGKYKMDLSRKERAAERMRVRRRPLTVVLAALVAGVLATAARVAHDQLVTNTAIDGPVLTFDWPEVQIGIGSYGEGPTGLTIFRFPHRVSAV